jgi:purine-nucleoside phosphorylase
MPSRLRPTASVAAEAILVGDPGRALLLAQELLEQPKMSNHARGLWGYTGNAKDRDQDLTIQSTGIGGPSAALVLGELGELGVRRAVRVGTCVGTAEEAELGELLIVREAVAVGGSAVAQGATLGEAVPPDAKLSAELALALGDAANEGATIASLDAHPTAGEARGGAIAADMQTAPLLARARALEIPVAALLIVAENSGGGWLGPEDLAELEKRSGRVAAATFSP